ncbi:MAG: type II toxin-antitoxin system VapC family toxin [Spirochaetes bacterium]|nr:type II toxin-antitoxin system VapC family toxin [Spirochaetota bacterium]
MVAFFDTSALLKRYRIEEGTPAVEKILEMVDKVVLCQIARSEAISALNFLKHRKLLEQSQYQKSLADLEADFADYEIIPLDLEVENRVKKIAERYGHKALDNIQLASALVARPDIFVTSDKKLQRLAENEKLKVKLV